KIVVASSAPQIRYPDCYGLDMTYFEEFIAFHAALALLKDKGKYNLVEQVYHQCKKQIELPDQEMENCVKEIYAPFSPQEISDKIAEMLSENGLKAELKVIYQPVEQLHEACPDNLGDWYFTGDYPTPG